MHTHNIKHFNQRNVMGRKIQKFIYKAKRVTKLYLTKSLESSKLQMSLIVLDDLKSHYLYLQSFKRLMIFFLFMH